MAILNTVAQFGRYRLRTRLAAGAACDVWLAEMDGAAMGTPPVIVKKLKGELSQHPAVIERFVARSLRAQALEHANIARVIEVIQSNHDLGVTSEHIDGKSLRQLISAVSAAGNALPIWCAIHIARCICEGLEQAHGMVDVQKQSFPLLHQGLRPENVFVTYTGQIKITDFGISHRALVEGLEGTPSGSRVSTHEEPNQRRETASVGERADLDGVGRTLYELLTGTCPNNAEDPSVDFIPPSHHASWVNAEVDQILRKILSPSYPGRIQSSSELRKTLEDYLAARRHDVSSSHISGLVTVLFSGECRDSSPPTMRFDDNAVQLARFKSRRTSPPDDSFRSSFENVAPTRPGIPGVPAGSAARPTLPSPSQDADSSQRVDLRGRDSRVDETEAAASDVEKANAPFRHDWDLALKRAREQAPFGSRTSGTLQAAKATPVPPPLDPTEQALIEFDKGLEFHKRGELESALAAWEKAITLDPQHRVCRANLNLLKKKLYHT